MPDDCIDGDGGCDDCGNTDGGGGCEKKNADGDEEPGEDDVCISLPCCCDAPLTLPNPEEECGLVAAMYWAGP
jgi:hypothetical protein